VESMGLFSGMSDDAVYLASAMADKPMAATPH
jgi:hypothetical protein